MGKMQTNVNEGQTRKSPRVPDSSMGVPDKTTVNDGARRSSVGKGHTLGPRQNSM